MKALDLKVKVLFIFFWDSFRKDAVGYFNCLNLQNPKFKILTIINFYLFNLKSQRLKHFKVTMSLKLHFSREHPECKLETSSYSQQLMDKSSRWQCSGNSVFSLKVPCEIFVSFSTFFTAVCMLLWLDCIVLQLHDFKCKL